MYYYNRDLTGLAITNMPGYVCSSSTLLQCAVHKHIHLATWDPNSGVSK